MRWLLVVLLLAGCLEAAPDDAAVVPDENAPDVTSDPSEAPADDEPPAEGDADQDADEGADDGESPARPTSITYGKQIHWDREVAAMLMGSSHVETERLEIPVGPGATAIDAALTWNDDMQDVDLHAKAPEPCGPTVGGTVDCATGIATQDGTAGWWTDLDGHMGAPDSPSEVAMDATDLERFACGRPPCTWTFDVWNKDLVEDLDMTLTVTVTYPDGVPETAYTDDQL